MLTFNFRKFLKSTCFAWLVYAFTAYLFASNPKNNGLGLLMVFMFFFSIWKLRNYGLDLSFLIPEKTAEVEPETLLKGGVYFGYKKKAPKGKPTHKDGHILVVGGAGSGKSACVAIPTLKRFWNAPFFAVDIKGELEANSKRKGLILNPYKENTFGYDPFYLARHSRDPEADIRDIVMTLVPEPGL